jgi:uncharacterized protein DUF559
VLIRHARTGTIGGVRHAFDVCIEIDGERRTDAAIADLARVQHGVVARAQLVALGLGRGAIDHRLAARRLHPLHRGVFAVGHRALTREGRWMAAEPRIEVTVPRPRRARSGVRVHSSALRDDEVTRHRGIPVTTPARTLLDLAAVLTRQQLERAVDRAEVRRLASPTSLDALLTRHATRHGTAHLRAILAAGRIGATVTRSRLEDEFIPVLDAHRLPRPQTNASIEVPGYKRIEPDAMWRDERVIVELDGFDTHGTRGAFEDDRARDAALQAAGWRTMRFTWRQLESEPDAIVARLRAVL